MLVNGDDECCDHHSPISIGMTSERDEMVQRWQAKRLLGAVATVGAVVAAVATLVTGAAGDDKIRMPSAEHGHALAVSFCSSCHIVDSDRKAAAQDGIPTFFIIANRIEQTKERILGALIEPHPPMPQPPLSMDDMIDVIAYLDSLRETAVGPPLLPPTGRPKPAVEQQPS